MKIYSCIVFPLYDTVGLFLRLLKRTVVASDLLVSELKTIVGESMSKIKVKDIEFNYELLNEAGKKQPVVFISGYTGDINAWRGYAESLAEKGHPALIFDNQGIGQTTELNVGPLTVKAMANNTFSLIKALKIKNPTIVSFAWGGCIAQQLAHDYPEAVRQLILVSSVMKFGPNARHNCELLTIYREKNEWAAYASLIYNTCFSKAWKTENAEKDFQQMLLPILPKTQTPEGQRRQLTALQAFDSTSWAKNIKVPTNILSPEEDLFATSAESFALAKQMSCPCDVIKASAHAILDEKKSLIQQKLESLIA
jgi:pimeloyl-ACP methyl ester carboxylesterase